MQRHLTARIVQQTPQPGAGIRHARASRSVVGQDANGQRAARAKRLAKAPQDLDKLAGAVDGRHYRTREKIAARIGVIAAKHRVVSSLRGTITDRPIVQIARGIQLRLPEPLGLKVTQIRWPQT
ncbi:hypothetical protein [Streptomyces sp. DT203]|uniref:hypothetical protein n=1 Tax=Streptomyces sp. DT203 TaxID=3393424 RepID=UPI003CF91B85